MIDAKIIAALAFAASLIVGSIWWELSIWSECRSDHSVWYCVRVLNH